MPTKEDALIAEAEQTLRELFSKIELNQQEREFADNAARTLTATALDLLDRVPYERRDTVRRLVLIVAIAMAVGSGSGWTSTADSPKLD